MAPLDQFIGAIERRKKQLEDVLESYKVFREKLDSLPPEIASEAEKMLVSAQAGDKSTQEGAGSDLAGKTSLECAKIILAERHNIPMHFSAVAKEALKRGYRGRGSGSQDEIESRTANSFWAAMSRASDLASTGKGHYKLRHWHRSESGGAQNQHPAAPTGGAQLTQADAAAKVLEDEGRPLSTGDIARLMTERGYYPTRPDSKQFKTSVFSALRRDPGRFKKVGQGTWDLKSRTASEDS